MNRQQIVGFTAGILSVISMLPQLVKIVKEKKASDVSIVMLLVMFGGLCFWVWYGFIREDYIIILSNCFSLLVNGSLTVLALKYKNKPGL